MKTATVPGLVPTDEPSDADLAETASSHYMAHEREAGENKMTPHQYAMKHKESDGIKGHRARLHLALEGLKKHDAMGGNDDEEKDAFNSAMEKYTE